MQMQSVEDLLYVGLTYIHNFEQQIAQSAPKMAQASSNPQLKDAFSKTESKSREYAQRIEQVFEQLGKEPKSEDNPIAKAMINEVNNMIANTEPSAVRDAALIVAANQQQAYRVAVYGSLNQYAGLIGQSEAVKLLQDSLQDSKNGDEKFTNIAETQVNQEAAQQPVAA